MEPWWSTERQNREFHDGFCRQLARELSRGHELYKLPVRIIARGNGDDALFEILDGSGRVAQVHLTWSKRRQRLPWPITSVYPSLAVWREEVMVPDHRNWFNNVRPE